MQEDSGQRRHSNYLDFELEIGHGTGREYPVAVLESPAGEARETMHFPFDELALDAHLDKLQIALLRSGGKRRRIPTQEEQAVQDFGQALFEAVFRAEVRSRYAVSRREAVQQGKGLRLKLRILSPKLSALPWEFIYDSSQAEYVCLSRKTPIVRYLESPDPLQPLTVTPPLRILGMIASPENLPSLDIGREKQRVERALQDLRGRGLVELEWMPGQTWRDLQEAMWGGPWHIFHFVGHGSFDPEADEGLVALADRAGRAHRLSATDLGRLLADHADLRLVLLNTCEGAQGSEHDIFSSTASILVRRGIPAVLAMQYEITDRAAIEFARAFYRALAHGMPVDEAVVAARKAISLGVTNTMEWGTPVLYMRSPDGVLFEVAGQQRVVPAVRRVFDLPPQEEKEREQRLRQLYVDGLGAFWVEDWEEACRTFGAIVDEHPEYRDAAAKLQEAERQRELTGLYAQALAAQEAEDWLGAVSALEQLVAGSPGHRDAAALLETAKVQKQLAELYVQAQQLHGAQQWQAVINVFARIAAIDPDYPDPDKLLPSAEQELEEQERQADLNDLYSSAVLEMDAGRWPEAHRRLVQLQETAPGFRQVEQLLARLESEMGREEAERQQQAQLAALYGKAINRVETRDWPEAERLLRELQGLDPGYPDLEPRLAEVISERERDEQLASLYERAEKAFDKGDWAQARDLYGQVSGLQPGYRDADRGMAEAERRQQLAEAYGQALEHLQAERWQEAIDGFRAIVEIEPDYVEPAHESAAALLVRAQEEKERAEMPPPPMAKPPRPAALPEEIRPRGKPRDLR